MATRIASAPAPASYASLLACRVCGLVHDAPELAPGTAAECSRCGANLERRIPGSLTLTTVFTLCALFLYWPANLYPILHMSLYGRESQNTVISGVLRFWQDGDIFVAAVVFLASVLVPFLKILGLLFLTTSVRLGWGKGRRWRTRLFQAIDAAGRWAMLDVFALAVLVSLVKLGRMADVVPGPGALAFTLVVVCTLLASFSFDTRLLWEEG